MQLSYTCSGKYKNQQFKVTSRKNCEQSPCEYCAVIEVNGIKQTQCIKNPYSISENIEEAIIAAKRYIDVSR